LVTDKERKRERDREKKRRRERERERGREKRESLIAQVNFSLAGLNSLHAMSAFFP
jgi:hypothetical protein